MKKIKKRKKQKNSKQFNRQFKKKFFTKKSAIIIICTVVILGAFGIGYQKVEKKAAKYQKTIDELKTDVKNIEQTNKTFEKENKGIDTDEFKERIARERLGMIKEGEISLQEAKEGEAAFSYFHLAGEVELEGRQDGGGGGEYSLKEFVEALAHDGIEGRDGVCFPAEVHGPLYFIPCGPFIVFIGLHIDGFAVSKSCEDIFFHAFISLFSTMTKYWSRMDIFHVPSSLTRVST